MNIKCAVEQKQGACRGGLLYEKLTTTGEQRLERIHKEKEDLYKNGVGKIKKLGAVDIQACAELHPMLKQLQRRQMDENQKRAAKKTPPAFTARGLNEHTLELATLSGRLTVCPTLPASMNLALLAA
jgi:hypothetical protein